MMVAVREGGRKRGPPGNGEHGSRSLTLRSAECFPRPGGECLRADLGSVSPWEQAVTRLLANALTVLKY